MSNLYPTLDAEMASDSMDYTVTGQPQPSSQPQRASIVECSDDIEIVLQISQEYVLMTYVHSDNQTRNVQSVLSVINEDPFPVLEFENERIKLREELFCLHSELDTFVLGGAQGPVDGTNYHLVIRLIDAPDDVLITLATIFMNNSTYKNLFVEELAPQNQEIGDKISSAIMTGAEGISKGIHWAGEKTSSLLNDQANTYVRDNEATSKPTQISGGVQKTVEYVSTGSKYVAKGTGYVASAIGSVASFAGKKLADKIDARYGSKSEADAKSKHTWTQVGKIASGVLSGYGTIWNALEKSGKAVAVASRDASTIVVQHKHGNDAGNVTYNAMNVGVNMTKTFFHIEDMGMKKICKNVAKSTGKAYLQKHLDRRAGKTNANIQSVQQPYIPITN